MGSFGKGEAGIFGRQPDELFPALPYEIWASEGSFSEEIVFFKIDHPREVSIEGRDGAVGILSWDDEALFCAEQMDGFRSVYDEVVSSALLREQFPQGCSVSRWHVDLEGRFAAEADAKDSRGNVGDPHVAEGHEGQRLGCKVFVAQGLQERTRKRSCQHANHPLFCHGCCIDFSIRPFGLQPFFDPREHARRAACCCGHVEVVFIETGSNPVVEDHALLVEHDTVSARSDFEFVPAVGVEHIEQP